MGYKDYFCNCFFVGYSYCKERRFKNNRKVQKDVGCIFVWISRLQYFIHCNDW